MEPRRWSRARVAVVAAALALSACAAEPGMFPGGAAAGATTTSVAAAGAPEQTGFSLPDVTARPITSADVIAMLPTGSGGVAESAGPSVEAVSNADLLTRATLDPNDEASDVVRFGRLFGAAGTYPHDDTTTAYAWIDVLSDGEAAHLYLLDYAGDVFKGLGGTHAPEATALGVDEFPMDVGEEAIGLDIRADASTRETAVVFRLGRIVVWASYARHDDADARVAVQYLAEELADRVVSTLTTGAPAAPRPDTPDHRFDASISIDAAGVGYTVEATGAVSGANLTCSLHLTSGAEERREDLWLVDGILWSRRGSAGDPQLVGGNLAERSLLALCPPWPLDARDTGLTTLGGETTTHQVNGIDASGGQSDLAGLERVLGVSLDGVIVDAFSYWVADGVPWLVELNVTAQGDASALEPLTGPGFGALGHITVTVRHRVFDLGEPIDPILPPG